MARNTVTPAIFGLPGARVLPPQAIGLTYTTNLLCWLKADKGVYSDNGTTLAVNTDPAYYWQDQSGNGYHAIQATSANRPVYTTNVINGKPILRFSGTNSHMTITGLDAVDNCSFFIVIIPDSTTPIGLFDSTGGDVPPIRNYPAGVWDWYDNAPQSDMTLANTNKVLLEFIHALDGTSTRSMSYYKNSTLIDTGSSGSGATATAWNNPKIGSINNGDAGWYDGDIAEFILYDETISTTNRELVETYLKNKYQLW